MLLINTKSDKYFMIDKDLNKDEIKNVEEARKIYNEKSINELLSDKEANKIRKEKLERIEDGKKNK